MTSAIVIGKSKDLHSPQPTPKFLGAPRRLPFVIKSLGAFLGARLKEIPASEHGQNKVRRGKREIGLDAEMLENSEEIKLPKARIIIVWNSRTNLPSRSAKPSAQYFSISRTPPPVRAMVRMKFLCNFSSSTRGVKRSIEAFLRERTTKTNIRIM